MANALSYPHMNTVAPSDSYVGRFAPSPTGFLHFGSLVTALGSFLQARSQKGQWLLRIEDIDPPREMVGASDSIMRCLEAHHLFWDGEVVYQSNRSNLYNHHIQCLTEQGLTYHCQCTRVQLAKHKLGQLCDCVNRDLSNQNCAIRFKYNNAQQPFYDVLLGQVDLPKYVLPTQFAIKRKDALFAYQLAVVVDDIQQGITEVARGADLVGSTFFQLALYNAFDRPAPAFLHFPVVVTEPGRKLSKHNHACEVNTNDASTNVVNALEFLGLSLTTELKQESIQNILEWAIQAWDLSNIPAKTECIDNRIGQADSI
jgi:glutamyl-Q tRNA(Asp) synthetase